MLEALVGSVEGIHGGVTVTLNVHVELPHELTAVHVTTVVPTGNVLPDAGAHVTVGGGVPLAVGVGYVTTAFEVIISEGQAPITGDPFTVTENEQLDEPHEFVAVHVTVDVPKLKVEPDAGTHVTVAAGVPVEDGVAQVGL